MPNLTIKAAKLEIERRSSTDPAIRSTFPATHVMNASGALLREVAASRKPRTVRTLTDVVTAALATEGAKWTPATGWTDAPVIAPVVALGFAPTVAPDAATVKRANSAFEIAFKRSPVGFRQDAGYNASCFVKEGVSKNKAIAAAVDAAWVRYIAAEEFAG